MNRKADEKMEKYRELVFEIGQLWSVKAKVIPLVVGALKTISIRHLSDPAEIGAIMLFETI